MSSSPGYLLTPRANLLLRAAAAMPFYAVARGRKPGIYSTWGEANAQVRGFSGAIFKKFNVHSAAQAFVVQNLGGSSGSSSSSNRLSTASASHSSVHAEPHRSLPPSGAYTTLNCKHPRSGAPDPAACFLLQFDGGSRGNPGIGGAGSVLYSPSTPARRVVFEGRSFSSSSVTNNEMEYSGLILGLGAARDLGIQRLLIEGDSQLIIRQLEGSYAVKAENLLGRFKAATDIIRNSFEYVGARHVFRESNVRADELANEAMDSRTSATRIFAHAMQQPAPALRGSIPPRGSTAHSSSSASSAGVVDLTQDDGEEEEEEELPPSRYRR